MSSSEIPSFAAQLFQAYSASLAESKDEECVASVVLPSSLTGEEVTGRQEPPHADLVEENETTTHCAAPTATTDLPQESGHHRVLGHTIEAWDQIGDIASEVAHSVLAKQAALVCETGKRELTLTLMSTSRSHSNKRRKVGEGGGDDLGGAIRPSCTAGSVTKSRGINRIGGVVVTSDDEGNNKDGSSDENSTTSLPSTVETMCASSVPPPETTLAHQVERMGRLSTYIMEIERYHRLMRSEMESMAQEESALYSSSL